MKYYYFIVCYYKILSIIKYYKNNSILYRKRIWNRNRYIIHFPPSTIHHPPSSFPPSCPSAPALPCPALPCPSPFPALLPCPTPTTTRGGLGFLRELLMEGNRLKWGGSDVISGTLFACKRVLYLKTPTKLKIRVSRGGSYWTLFLRLVALFKSKTLLKNHQFCV
jgi:hypothetical protein